MLVDDTCGLQAKQSAPRSKTYMASDKTRSGLFPGLGYLESPLLVLCCSSAALSVPPPKGWGRLRMQDWPAYQRAVLGAGPCATSPQFLTVSGLVATKEGARLLFRH